MTPDPIAPRWSGTVIVAATGPSLTHLVAEDCWGWPTIAINDAWRLMPWADICYGADYQWWHCHKGLPDFAGEKWIVRTDQQSNTRQWVIDQYKLRVVLGRSGDTFSVDPAFIRLGILNVGANSGFQAINLAILLGATEIVLVGFDMRKVDNKAHFFGDHPKKLNKKQNFRNWIANIATAAASVPPGVRIVNCTPDSALRCFAMRELREVLHGAEAHRAA
jgi:hypothetical protein